MMPPDPPPGLPIEEPLTSIAETGRNEAFWSYVDVAMFISLGFLSFLVMGGGVLALRATGLFNLALQLVFAQCILYVLVIGALYLIIRVRYRASFWWAMGYRHGTGFWPAWVAAGVLLAIGVAVLGAVLRAPEIPLPFQDLLRGRSAVIALGILVVVLGPFCEELVFRGFLMPLFIRSLGALGGILVAAVLFGGLHAPEYRFAWQQVLLISAAGAAFGWARYRTRSTFPALAMHAGFNGIQFLLFLAFQNGAK